MSLWVWNELSRAVNAQAAGNGPSVTGISIDTRSLQRGDLFIALSGDPGSQFRGPGGVPPANAGDGHNFISQAEAAGAVAALVHKQVDTALPLLMVKDSLEALWDLARASILRCQARRVAVTGSSGKTTARAFLQQVLADQGLTHASVGSFNNHWGVPLSIARMPVASHYGIFEIGMNHPGEILPLAKLVQPEVALVLNVHPAHIGAFGHLEGIREEKLSIAQGLVDDGVLVLPDALASASSYINQLTFGASSAASVRLLNMQPRQDQPVGLEVEVSIVGRKRVFLTEFSGEHRVMTCLAVLTVAHALGADSGRACASLRHVQPPEGRGNQLLVNGVRLIDDSYNANPASMGYALATLGASAATGTVRQGRRIAILGDMLELGAGSAELHASLRDQCHQVDKVIAVGPAMGRLFDLLPEDKRWFHVDSVSAIEMADLAGALREGDTVLVKGSNRVFWVNKFVPQLASALRKSV